MQLQTYVQDNDAWHLVSDGAFTPGPSFPAWVRAVPPPVVRREPDRAAEVQQGRRVRRRGGKRMNSARSPGIARAEGDPADEVLVVLCHHIAGVVLKSEYC